MKILFLDIDGVLNSEEYFAKFERTPRVVVPQFRDNEHKEMLLDPEAVARLNKIMEAVPETNIIISSAWRAHCNREQIKLYLALRGFQFENRIIGQTRYRPGISCARKDEIIEWLLDNLGKFESFVILDDIGDMGNRSHRHVHTLWFEDPETACICHEGLEDQHIQQAIDILNTPIGGFEGESSKGSL